MRWGYANKLGPFELWDALGFEDVVRRLEQEGRVVPDNLREAKSAYRGTAYFDVGTKQYRELEARPGVVVLKHCRGGDKEPRRVAGRPWRRRAVRGVPQQDEHDRRGQPGHDPRGPGGTGAQFRRDGDWQSGRQLLGGREPDDGAAGRAGRRVGRTGPGRSPVPAGQHGAEVCAEAGGGGAVRTDAGRRLRDCAACGARAGVGGTLHGSGGGRRWA